MYLPTYIYHSLPRPLKRPVCTLTGTIGRPSARSLALRRRGFGALVSFALGSRLQRCVTLARTYLGPYPSSLHVVIYHICELQIPSIYHKPSRQPPRVLNGLTPPFVSRVEPPSGFEPQASVPIYIYIYIYTHINLAFLTYIYLYTYICLYTNTYVCICMNPSAYITRYPARSDALSVLFTGMLGRLSARPLALRRPGFGVLVSVALGSRLPSYLTSASILAYAPPQNCITQA